MTQSTAAHTITVDIKCNTKPLSQLESQLEHIAELLESIRGQTLVDGGTVAELLDRINSQHYGAGMKLAVDKGSKVTITADGFKVCDPAGQMRVVIPRLIEAAVSEAKIINDDHLRQIVREEITHELMPGGLLSK
ncbi:hypothetical protein FE394_08735 [Xenorhabdus sp. Reich]|uniref:Phage protein n=1 Tax=Xenorhabdus littoralis TaxID=2582835 RepID=A0ABU4SL33_9GAMM|nr:hypothetical protein [Xenorhabdus sp. Reich]MDX7999286.1 hypothetical protein [Xenorhabdus sp. Reich]